MQVQQCLLTMAAGTCAADQSCSRIVLWLEHELCKVQQVDGPDCQYEWIQHLDLMPLWHPGRRILWEVSISWM